MKKNMIAFLLVGWIFVSCIAAPAGAGEWTVYESSEYGFTMLVPKETNFQEKEYEGGWGCLSADYQGIKLYAIGKLGPAAAPEEIEKFGVKVTGVPAKKWEEIDHGKNQAGWKWYCTVKALDGEKILFGGYGTGPKGSYMLVLKTTKKDYEENYGDYVKWYESIRLF